MSNKAAIAAGMSLLAGLWLAEAAFERWSDVRVGTRALPLRQPLDTLPVAIGQWHGRTVSVDPETIEVTESDEFIRRDYYDASGRVVAMQVAYYRGLHRLIPHGPGVCYPMAGWKTARHGFVTDPGGVPGYHCFVFSKELCRQAVIYWYYVNGTKLSSPLWTRFSFASRIVRGVGGSIVQVQLGTPVTGSEQGCFELLDAFRRELTGPLEACLPEKWK